ncbi:MAG TPA: hypothetical protein VFZ77_08695, partial [Acidimicrobiales bacterium]
MADPAGPGSGEGAVPERGGNGRDPLAAPPDRAPASASEQAGITAGRHGRQAGAGAAPGTEARRAPDAVSAPPPATAAEAAHRLASVGAGVALTELLAGFIGELRSAGLPVSLTENLDAMAAVQHIPLDDRDAFKYALGATLVKNAAHWRV